MIQKLSQEEFLKTFERVPRVAFNLLIEDGEGKVLLTKRAIPPEEGSWHFPGSFLLKDEAINECLQRVARDEFGYTLLEKAQLAGVFEDLNKDPRGHIIDVVYKVILKDQLPLLVTSETKEAAYFGKLPQDMGFNHKESLLCLGYKD
jgi:8-oxo-dGTP diphosphatase